MNLKLMVREVRVLALLGAIAFAVGIGANQSLSTANMQKNSAGNVQIVDGSESTGKPPKPKPFMPPIEHVQYADGSESTGKPPKPKPAKFTIAPLQIADGSESTGSGKPPKPKNS